MTCVCLKKIKFHGWNRGSKFISLKYPPSGW